MNAALNTHEYKQAASADAAAFERDKQIAAAIEKLTLQSSAVEVHAVVYMLDGLTDYEIDDGIEQIVDRVSASDVGKRKRTQKAKMLWAALKEHQKAQKATMPKEKRERTKLGKPDGGVAALVMDFVDNDGRRCRELRSEADQVGAAALEAHEALVAQVEMLAAGYQVLTDAVSLAGRGDIEINYDCALYQCTKDDDLVPICRPIVPTGRGGKGDRTGWGLRVLLLDPNNEWQDAFLTYTDLATANVKPLADRGFPISQRQAGAVFEVLMRCEPPVLPLAEIGGWQGDKFDCFVWGDTALGSDGNAGNVIVPTVGARFSTKGNLASWKREVAGRALGNVCFEGAILSALSAPCKRIVGIRSSGETVYGDSHGGKTTAGYGGLSVYEPPTGRIGFTATPAGFERECVAHNDRYMLLDGTETANDKQKVHDFLLIIGDGQTKPMASGKSEMATRDPINFVTEAYTTGEHSNRVLFRKHNIAMADGPESRVPNIPFVKTTEHGGYGPAGGSAFAKDYERACRENYGAAGAAWIKALMVSANREKLVARFTGAREALLKAATEERGAVDGQESVFIDRAALKIAAGELAVDAGILPWPMERPAQVVADEYRRWIDGRGGAGSSVALRAIEHAYAFVRTYPNKFFDLDADPATQDQDGRRMFEVMGSRNVEVIGGQRFTAWAIDAGNTTAIERVFGTREIDAGVRELEQRTLAALERWRKAGKPDTYPWPDVMVLTRRTSKVRQGKAPGPHDRGLRIERMGGLKCFVLLTKALPTAQERQEEQEGRSRRSQQAGETAAQAMH